MTRRRRQRGFSLVLVLVVLAVAGVLLGASARRSCQAALNASTRTQHLQRTWGRRTLVGLAKRQAETWLRRQEVRDRAPARSTALSVTLGPQRFRMLLSDEQAKANINVLWDRFGAEELPSIIRRLQSGGSAAPIELRPGRFDDSVLSLIDPEFTSPDQLFQYQHISALIDLKGASLRPTALENLTLWGDGRLRLLRTSPRAVRAIFKGVLTRVECDELIAAQQETPDAMVHELLNELEWDDELRGKAAGALTDHSACFSLWMVADSDGRPIVQLHVFRDVDPTTSPSAKVFQWR